jgi:hypothetical protein
MNRLTHWVTPLAVLGADSVWAGWVGVDIGPLVREGVPGIGHRTQTNHYFDYHHSPADTFDKIDPTILAQNVAAVAAVTYALAEDPEPLRQAGGKTRRIEFLE